MYQAINFKVKKAGKELLMASLKEDISHLYYDIKWEDTSLALANGSVEVKARLSLPAPDRPLYPILRHPHTGFATLFAALRAY